MSLCKILLQASADINAVTEHGASALSHAIILNKNIETCKYLIESGADFNFQMMEGKSFIEHINSEPGFKELSQYIVAKVGVPQHLTTKTKDQEDLPLKSKPKRFKNSLYLK
tara:strand:- start:4282 stop:4617 length:336 start_codon:yes stop_codon:yes gene_type:complete